MPVKEVYEAALARLPAFTANMIDPDLLKILCCPETHQEVRLAEAAVIDKLNGQIAAGTSEEPRRPTGAGEDRRRA